MKGEGGGLGRGGGGGEGGEDYYILSNSSEYHPHDWTDDSFFPPNRTNTSRIPQNSHSQNHTPDFSKTLSDTHPDMDEAFQCLYQPLACRPSNPALNNHYYPHSDRLLIVSNSVSLNALKPGAALVGNCLSE